MTFKDTLLAAQTDDEIDVAFELIFDSVHDAWAADNFAEVKEVVGWAAQPSVATQLNYEVLLSLLRLVFSVRSHVAEQWNALLEITRQELHRRGQPEAEALLHGLIPVGIEYEGMSSPTYDHATLTTLITHLGRAPNGQLDKEFTELSREFVAEPQTLEETLKFIRNLQDECVFTAGASNVVMTLFALMLEGYPESEEEKAARRVVLEKKYGL